MVQTVFLDTNVILDYLENRHHEVRDIIAQLLLLHKKGRIALATSIFNVAEVIDKEFEIHFSGWCINERMSFDEMSRSRRNEKLYREVSEKNKNTVEKRIKEFISQNEIILLTLPGDASRYGELYDLVYSYQLQSQDALMIAAALANNATYFLSNDSDLIKSVSDIFPYAYDLRNEGRRKAFRNDVLEAI
jgi:predicted nucleic acid-binding protein